MICSLLSKVRFVPIVFALGKEYAGGDIAVCFKNFLRNGLYGPVTSIVDSEEDMKKQKKVSLSFLMYTLLLCFVPRF